VHIHFCLPSRGTILKERNSVDESGVSFSLFNCFLWYTALYRAESVSA